MKNSGETLNVDIKIYNSLLFHSAINNRYDEFPSTYEIVRRMTLYDITMLYEVNGVDIQWKTTRVIVSNEWVMRIMKVLRTV